MKDRPEWLLDYASNTYSQTGEDGVLAKILEMLPETDRWCVEFGAWDGIHLSNVRRLVKEAGYSVIFIDGDSEKFRALKKNYSDNKKVIAVNAFVGFTAEDGLDKILSVHNIPKNFDFLSIDIDGNDYHVWKAIEVYKPKVVCVEFNATIPSEVDFVQPANPAIAQGCSLFAFDKLARKKGYELVSVLKSNAFFVDRAYFKHFGISNNAPSILRKDLSLITWIFSGFDGSIHLAGAKFLPWHGLPIDEQMIQVLPASLQVYPDNYSESQKKQFQSLRDKKESEAKFEPKNDLERFMQFTLSGKMKVKEFLNEFIKNEVFVLLDKEAESGSTKPVFSPLILTSNKNEPLIAVFTIPERWRYLQPQVPQFRFEKTVSAKWLINILSANMGLTINPGSPTCLEWSVKELQQFRDQHLKK